MRRASDGKDRLGGDGPQQSLERIGSSLLLVVIVTVVLLHRVNVSEHDTTAPLLASSEPVVRVAGPDHDAGLPVPSTPTVPVVESSTALGRGGNTSPDQIAVAPMLSPAALATYQPNELGHIPVLMYHGFTTNPEYLDEWTRTPDGFRQDLQWLYDHGFFIVSIANLLSNEISVPPGKHPVVLTFDDSSSSQFQLLADATGERYPDPITAVGVMEAFFAEHPDFGRGGHFAVVPNNCFHRDEEVTTCEERLIWLAEHGYEIGNHTWWHQNLGDADDERFMSQIGDTKLWMDERVPGDANLSNVLALPFGEYPATEWQYSMLVNGFDWEGQRIQMVAILTVGGGIGVSPNSSVWDRWSIGRINTDEGTLGYWKEQIDSGAKTMYTSDGNPTSITIPANLPEDLADQFDPEVIASQGRSLIRYSSEPAGEQADPGSQASGLTADRRWAVTRRNQPSGARYLEKTKPIHRVNPSGRGYAQQNTLELPRHSRSGVYRSRATPKCSPKAET